jgi:hypothetical protein
VLGAINPKSTPALYALAKTVASRAVVIPDFSDGIHTASSGVGAVSACASLSLSSLPGLKPASRFAAMVMVSPTRAALASEADPQVLIGCSYALVFV